MRSFCLLPAVLINFLYFTNGYKILAILPFPSKSHFYIGNAIAESLLEAGHEVTVVSPFPTKNPPSNRREIIINEIGDVFGSENAPDVFEFQKLNPVVTQLLIFNLGADLVEKIFSSQKFKDLLNSKEKYDAIIFEIFGADVFVGLKQHFNCPIIGYSTFGQTKWITQFNGNPNLPSYTVSPFLSYSGKMTFYQRFVNKMFSFIEHLLLEFIYHPKQRNFYEKFFPNSKSTFDKDLKDVSLIFQNDHFTSAMPRPYLPNVIEIGGIHVKKPKPLPKEWQNYLDSSKDGVIYFSMGSMLQSKNWPTNKREALAKAFSKLKIKVLWKYENETLPNQPKNVKIGKWLPQRDILAHPNVKLFITHGGLLGTTEALMSGVPIIAIPVYGDQRMNAARAANAGYGLKLNFEDITEMNVLKVVNEILDNPKYHQTAQLKSKRFNDRPLSPQESVVYWTEYVINHQGAPQLKSPGVDLSFIQFHSIDVYATLMIIASILLTSIYFSIKFIRQKLFGKPAATEKVKFN